MQKKIQILPLLLAILAVAILLSLGFWQLSRLKEKELFIDSMRHNLNNPPVDLKTLSGNKLYAKIKVDGHFLPDKNIHLYGRKSRSTEKDGYYLITPFQTNDNKIILVARGWFPHKYKKTVDNVIAIQDVIPAKAGIQKNYNNTKNWIPASAGMTESSEGIADNVIDNSVEISGVILPTEKNRLFVPGNDMVNNVWFTLDLQQASKVLGLNLENFYLIMHSPADNPSEILKALSTEHLLHVRNDHLEYAITWFSLAIALVVIFVVYHVRWKE